MLNVTKQLIEESLDVIALDTKHYLSVAARQQIYLSFGSTFLASAKNPKRNFVNSGKMKRTKGDYVRSWLGILTAREVTPVWKDVLQQKSLLKHGFNFVDANLSLFQQTGNFLNSGQEFPEYLLQLAERVLQNKIDFETACEEADLADTIIGNSLGFNQEEYPLEAHHVNLAAYHALREALGQPPYELTNIEKLPENLFTPYKAAPASAAFMAYAGIYEKNQCTGEFDSQASLEFWAWWLREAIPQAWQLAQTTLGSQIGL